jgi:hypothetical protein
MRFAMGDRLEDNSELVQDCCRYQEGILSEANMRRKWGFAESVWENLAENTALLSAVEEEKLRRMRSGTAKKEKAQLHVLKAPDVAAKIMLDENANNRHRLDACKVLDDFSATGPQAAPAADRFIIHIDLTGDSGTRHVEVYDKAISIDPNDTAPDISINTDPPQPAAIASEPAAPPTSDPVEASFAAMMRLG